jgi:translation initiation factor 2B subunit (eIF-2B alpha/beta/delta family)
MSVTIGGMDEGLERLAGDAESGASELVPLGLAILRRAVPGGHEALLAAARGVCTAQPSMAPLWRAAALALADPDRAAEALEHVEQRWRRAGAALCRVARGVLSPGDGRPLRLVTSSYSGSVLAVLRDLASAHPLSVACAEGRPRQEGRRLAAALTEAGIRVEFFTDAALPSALGGADALLLGADAIAPAWFLNKTGSLALASAASVAGVPAFVLATRDKFLPGPLASRLAVAEHDPAEVWPAHPEGVSVRNPYFERVPLHLVAAVLADTGQLGVDMVDEACRASIPGLRQETIDSLPGGM